VFNLCRLWHVRSVCPQRSVALSTHSHTLACLCSHQSHRLHICTARICHYTLPLQIACKHKHGRVFRLPYLASTAVSVCDTEGIKIAMTTRYAGKKVLGTQKVKSIGVMWGPRALSNASGAEHSRLKKLMYPTFSVNASY
jgi:cytochrome P450